MTRTTTLIFATIALLHGVASLTAASCSVTSPFLTCGAIISVQPTHFTVDVSDPVGPSNSRCERFYRERNPGRTRLPD
jgi:hypothetical protein